VDIEHQRILLFRVEPRRVGDYAVEFLLVAGPGDCFGLSPFEVIERGVEVGQAHRLAGERRQVIKLEDRSGVVPIIAN